MDYVGIEDQSGTDVREIVMERIERSGLPIPPKPTDLDSEGYSIFDEWEDLKRQYGGIANIPFNSLGDFLDRWTALVTYSRWVEAVADMEQVTAREMKEKVKKQLYVLQEGGRELRDASVYTDSSYVKWHDKYSESLSLYIQVKALREGYEKRADALSREITRRGNDVVDQRRSMNRGYNNG